MLAIAAGAREESLRFIEQLGVRNLLIQAKPIATEQEMNERRRSSPGLTDRDVRILKTNLQGVAALSARKTMHPTTVLPKPSGLVPELYGVRPAYAEIHNWQFAEGAPFSDRDDGASAAVCVLGEQAKVSVFGYGGAVGDYVKVNETWLQVKGVLRHQIASSSMADAQDPNLVIYIPFNTFQYRFWDSSGWLKDELQAVDIQLKPAVDSVEAAKVVTAILNSTHHDTPDFTVTIPAELLAQQQRAQSIFTYVMVAIAAISLLVGGIGIMNIVLATVLERTREIGIRRATGARRIDIVRQFLIESVLISIAGGVVGIAFGYFLSWLIASSAHWKTIVTPVSVVVAFGVSVAVGVDIRYLPGAQGGTDRPD